MGSASTVSGNKLQFLKPSKSLHWKFHGTEDALKEKLMCSVSVALLFDGASKGNHEVSGVGGVIFFPGRLIHLNFSWGLGSMTNNQAECYSLLMVIQLAKGKGFKSIQIFGDSEMLVKTLNTVVTFNNSLLNVILQRIKTTLKCFDSVESYHILWGLNKFVDSLANKGCLLPQGTLSIDGETCVFHPIP